MMKAFRQILKSIIPLQFQPLARRVYWLYRPFVRHRYEPLLYAGSNVTCPICGRNFRRFMPFDSTGEPDRQCPRCWSVDRHRLLYLYLRDRTDLFSARLRLLHFAPEYCFQRIFRKLPQLDYVSCDLNSPLASRNFDITAIPFPDESFDVIICSHVLEHIPDDRKAMSELHRVLKTGGWAILLVPLDGDRAVTFEDETVTTPEGRKTAFGQSDHVRIYGRDYADRLGQAGFRVEVHDHLGGLDPELVKRYGVQRSQVIYHCWK